MKSRQGNVSLSEQLEDRRLLTAVTVSNSLDVINAPDTSSISALIADDGSDGISLREAVTAANNTTGSDTITFDASLSGQTISLSLGELVITDELMIDASALASRITIDAQQQSRVIFIGTTPGNVTLNNLVLTGGRTAEHAAEGAGIFFDPPSISGSLNVTNSVVTGNETANALGDGGGISARFGRLTLTVSTVSGNVAGGSGKGGGIHSWNSTVIVNNSTISGNISTDGGGGIYSYFGDVELNGSTVSGNIAARNGGGIGNRIDRVIAKNSTITNNQASGLGGGIYGFTQTTSLQMENTILAANLENGLASDLFWTQAIHTFRYNLVGTNTGNALIESPVPDADGNLIGGNTNGVIDPRLDALADNGGPTQTHELLAGSPAIDAGSSTLAVDQRGIPRPLDHPSVANATNGVDIGAIEQGEFGSLLVTTANDVVDNLDFLTSLREAITFANSQSGTDAITFDAGGFATAQTINLNSQLPTITDAVTITGPGPNLLTIDAGGGTDGSIGNGDGYRIFSVNDGVASSRINVAIHGLTLSGGDPTGNGGAIENVREHVNLENTTISGNAATNGGGIYNDLGGIARIVNSTIVGNQADHLGGGLFNGNQLSTRNSTISANSADGGGGVSNRAFLELTNSTLSGNLASTGGGILNVKLDARLYSTIVANSPSGGDIVVQGGAVFGNNNLVEDGSDGLPDTITGDPLLGPLQDNGGSTLTHALLNGSPAFNAGDTNSVLPQLGTDQRGTGFDRVVGAIVDIGAVESQSELNSLRVTTANDIVDATDLATSLREAISFANSQSGANTITFDASVFNGESADVIQLTGGELVATDSLTVDASPLLQNAEVDAQQNSRIINFTASTGDLHLRGLTLRNGRTTTAGVQGAGGGVRFASTGTLELTDSTLSGNSTTGGITSYTYAHGGGIFASNGSVVLTRSTVSGNGTHGAGARGGGIATTVGSVSLLDSIVSGNASVAGGGVATYGGGVTLQRSRIEDNNSKGNGGGVATGSGVVSIGDSTISRNTAEGFGGGVFSVSGSVAFNGTTINANMATGFGGGIATSNGPLSLSNSTLSANRTTGNGAHGGGIVTSSSPLSLVNSTVTDNRTEGTGANGGGIYVFDADTNASLTIQNSILAGNAVPVGSSGPDLIPDAQSTVDIDYSFIGDADGLVIAGTGNQVGDNSTNGALDPMLGPLADNGGPNQTHALLAGSLAIDSGDPNFDANAFVPPRIHDQRGIGFDRLKAGRIDMGAFELQNQSPVFSSPTTVNVAENATMVQMHTVTDVDLPAQSMTFSISGIEGDNDKFEIAGNGLRFKVAPDFENPSDVGGAPGDNVYEVTVRADDGNGGTTPQVVSVTVTPVNDILPMFTTPNSATVEENTQFVHVLGATDADVPAQPITYSIGGTGADNDKFEIVSDTQLQFKTPPDFESPGSTSNTNVYEVSVQADDGVGATEQTIAVAVTPVNDNVPVVTSNVSASVPENTIFVSSLTATDSDLPTQSVSFRMLGETPSGDLGPGQSLEVEQTITSPDGTATLILQSDGNLVIYKSGVPSWASATDGSTAVRATMHADGNLALMDAGGSVVWQSNSGSNSNALARLRVTNSGNPVVLRVDESKIWESPPSTFDGGGTVFSPSPLASEFIKAADTDLFQVMPGNQLQFMTAPNFENPADADGNNVYDLTVLADDGNGGITPQTLAVTVTDAAESQTFVVDIHGVNETLYDLDPNFGNAGVRYDSASFTATWRLDPNDVAQFAVDHVLLELDADAGGILGHNGNLRLDGEHAINGSTIFPSGNGVEGGDFLFSLRVLPGDFNRSGAAAINDVGGARSGLGSQSGDSDYSIFADTNASGGIAVNDVNPLRNNLGQGTPSTAPAVPAVMAVAAVPTPKRSLPERNIDIVMAAILKDDSEFAFDPPSVN